MNKIILALLLGVNLNAYDNYKIKTNVTADVFGMLNIKYEFKVTDSISIEPTFTMLPYTEKYDLISGINIYLYQNKVMNSNGFFTSFGVYRGIIHPEEYYNYSIGYQWFFNATGIRYTSFELGLIHKREFFTSESNVIIPTIYFNIAF
jgi:hypothetical protein